MSYAQGPIQPRLDTTVGGLPYIKTTTNGTTCALGQNEISMSAPYAIFGSTADSFCKLYATNYFGTRSLQAKNTISGFYPDFYIADPTEIKSTWTGFGPTVELPGLSNIKYEVIKVYGNTVNINGHDVLTDIGIQITIEDGGTLVEAPSGSGYYRKLGTIIST